MTSNFSSMKKLLVVIALLSGLQLKYWAQWTNDPNNPAVVSDFSNDQMDLQTVKDGSGGLFVFWKDFRVQSDMAEVYGQHYNGDGVAQWPEDGKLILTGLGNIIQFRVYRFDDGQMIIGWYNVSTLDLNNSKLWFQRLDDEGEKMWQDDLALSQVNSDESLVVWSYVHFDLLRDSIGYRVCFTTNSFGYYQYRISRFNSDGIMSTPFHGVGFGSPFEQTIGRMTSDGANGAYIYKSTGNGSGAALYCMRLDDLATQLWTNWIQVTDAAGLNYAFDAIGDAGGVTFLWEGDYNIKATRLTSTGSFAWSGQATPLVVSGAENNQFRPYWKKTGNDYFVVWSDNRPGVLGNSAIYGQRFNITGQLLWQNNGNEIANLNTFSPFAKFDFNDEGNLVVSHKANTIGMVLHECTIDGIVISDPSGIPVMAPMYCPSEAQFEILCLDNRTTLVCERSQFSNNDLYISGVGGPTIINIEQNISACESYTINGETFEDSGVYMQELPGDTLLTLNLTITNVLATTTLNGNTLTADNIQGNFSWLNCYTNTLEPGNTNAFTAAVTGEYALIVELNGCIDTSACNLITVMGLDELKWENLCTVFPNPANDLLQIQSKKIWSNAEIRVSDTQGKTIFTESNANGSYFSIDINKLEAGLYFLQVTDKEKAYSITWIKD
jgi:Secretion system C-terminal sorting domain